MSKKLFIIGTGFDKSHGLDTLYEDFHQYLRSEYPEADEAGRPLLSGRMV